MKKITTLLLLMILLTSHSLSAQTKEALLLKSRHQKTAAWIMLGGGAGLLGAGSLATLYGVADIAVGQHNHNKLDAAGVLIITGGAAILGSVPLFIAASKNKHKAMSFTFANQPISPQVKNILGNKPIPSITLQFNL